jgi:hypothetical protein
MSEHAGTPGSGCSASSRRTFEDRPDGTRVRPPPGLHLGTVSIFPLRDVPPCELNYVPALTLYVASTSTDGLATFRPFRSGSARGHQAMSCFG